MQIILKKQLFLRGVTHPIGATVDVEKAKALRLIQGGHATSAEPHVEPLTRRQLIHAKNPLKPTVRNKANEQQQAVDLKSATGNESGSVQTSAEETAPSPLAVLKIDEDLIGVLNGAGIETPEQVVAFEDLSKIKGISKTMAAKLRNAAIAALPAPDDDTETES